VPITKLRKFGQVPYTQIPNEIIYSLNDPIAISIYVYLMCKPENWTIRKRDILKGIGITDYRYRQGRQVLVDAGLWVNAEIRTDEGRIEGSIIWINALPPEATHRDVDRPHVGHTTSRLINTLSKKDLLQKKDKPMKPDGFGAFWRAYPKKKNKQAAIKAFNRQKINGELQTIIDDIEYKMEMDDEWVRNNGTYIPYPASYLNGRRWEDERDIETSNNQSFLDNLL